MPLNGLVETASSLCLLQLVCQGHNSPALVAAAFAPCSCHSCCMLYLLEQGCSLLLQGLHSGQHGPLWHPPCSAGRELTDRCSLLGNRADCLGLVAAFQQPG